MSAICLDCLPEEAFGVFPYALFSFWKSKDNWNKVNPYASFLDTVDFRIGSYKSLVWRHLYFNIKKDLAISFLTTYSKICSRGTKIYKNIVLMNVCKLCQKKG